MDLTKCTVKKLSHKLKSKFISVPELTKLFLDKINTNDEKYNCYITVCRKKAMEQAREIQKKFDAGIVSSPLAGIPCGIKDNLCTQDILTTCASKMLYNFRPPYTATAVKKLYDNDCVVLGKLNLDEFAMGSTTENSHFKTTKNPNDISKVPGGSSGGSAAAVFANMAAFSLGTDTGGSIRQPASFCGVVGLKPTYGAVSRYGLIAFASSLDQIGPLTKNVEDCAFVLNAITGYDKKDATSAKIDYPDYTKALVNDVKGMKIAVPKEYTNDNVNPEVIKQIKAAADKYEKMGAYLKEVSLPSTEYAIPAYYIISSAEASSNLARYDGVKYGYRTEEFDDLTELYKKSRSEGFGPEVKRRIMLGTFALSSGYYDDYYKKALKVRTLITEEFNKIFDNFDLILGPVSPVTAYNLKEKTNNPLQMYLGDIFTVSANIAGLPAISVPVGTDKNNLPVGMQLIGKPFDEKTLIKAAYTYEVNSNEVNL